MSNKPKNRTEQLSKQEINKLQEAMRDESFVQQLADYARELQDPARRRQYEQELEQLERERGMTCTFINPKPGYVLKAAGAQHKVFVNICHDPNVGEPSSRPGVSDGKPGLSWSIPYSLSQPRQDLDKAGQECTVFDAVFHPDTAHLAKSNPRFKCLVHDTALDAVERALGGVSLNRKDLKFPKMQFKGVIRPTVIRRPLSEQPGDSETKEAGETTAAVSDGVRRPKYLIKHRSVTDMQDHSLDLRSQTYLNGPGTRPREIVVEIRLPGVETAAKVDLDVQEKQLVLSTSDPVRYHLDIELPFPVLEENGSAKFEKDNQCLLVTLPVRSAQPIVDRLSSNDSGIEVDVRTKEGDDQFREKSDDSSSTEELPERTSTFTAKDEFRTNVCDESGDCDEQNGGGAVVAPPKDDFLNEDLTYTLPAFLCTVQANVITFTLEVKNVSPESVEKRLLPDNKGVQVKFCSIGSGHVPLHYSFLVSFLSVMHLPSDGVELEVWDNNVVLQIPFLDGMCSYQIGSSLADVKEKIYSLEQIPTDLGDECEERNSKKKHFKKGKEKHPKQIAKEKKEKKIKALNEELDKDRKQRHCSGDSLDSFLSESDMEYAKDTENEDLDAVETAEEDEDEGGKLVVEVEPTRCKRASSEESSSLRGILKRKSFDLERKRWHSESNVDEFVWDSNGKLCSMTSLEEDDEVMSSSQKKSVRFSDIVQRQLYRTTSTILGKTAKNKKKAEKKKRAAERRMSESDADARSEEGVLLNTPATALHMDESHDDSGLASSFEEAVVLSSDGVATDQKSKAKRKTKRKVKTIELTNDLIFDLDI